MRSAQRISVEPEIVDAIVRGYDAEAVFERDGVLDRLRAALVEKFAGRQVLAHPTASRALGTPRSAVESTPPDVRERVVYLHGRGFAMDDIRRRLAVLGEPISLQTIADIVTSVRAEARVWQERALDHSYPIIIFERMRVKWRDGTGTSARDCHFAIAFQTRGTKEVLGVWFEHENADAFWRSVFADLSNRGLKDVIYVVAAAARSLEVSALALGPAVVVKNPCELIRQSLNLATTKDRAVIQKSLRAIHSAANEADARSNLECFITNELGEKYPAIGPKWRRSWSEIAPFFAIPLELRRVMTSIYASDTIRRAFQRTLRVNGHMSSAEEASTLMYVAMRDVLNKWRRPQREWHSAKTCLAVMFPDRFVP